MVLGAQRPCAAKCKFNTDIQLFLGQVQATMQRGSAMKRTLAAAFLAVSAAYIRARRVVLGTALEVTHSDSFSGTRLHRSGAPTSQVFTAYHKGLMLAVALLLCKLQSVRQSSNDYLPSRCSMRSSRGRSWLTCGRLWSPQSWHRCTSALAYRCLVQGLLLLSGRQCNGGRALPLLWWWPLLAYLRGGFLCPVRFSMDDA